MTADNTHAESRILARAVVRYDDMRTRWPEGVARHAAVHSLAENARLDYTTAAERLADALARRAARKLGGLDNGTT